SVPPSVITTPPVMPSAQQPSLTAPNPSALGIPPKSPARPSPSVPSVTGLEYGIDGNNLETDVGTLPKRAPPRTRERPSVKPHQGGPPPTPRDPASDVLN